MVLQKSLYRPVQTKDDNYNNIVLKIILNVKEYQFTPQLSNNIISLFPFVNHFQNDFFQLMIVKNSSQSESFLL